MTNKRLFHVILLILAINLPALDLRPEKRKIPVFHGSLGALSNLIFLELDATMTVVYSKSTCALEIIWRGYVKEVSANQFEITGPVIHKPEKKGWFTMNKSVEERATCWFVSLEHGKRGIELTWKVSGPEGETTIKEIPEYDDHYGSPSLYRKFFVTKHPGGTTLKQHLSGGYVTEQWQSAGGPVQIKGKSGKKYFKVMGNGEFRIKGNWSE